jgi:hypothetical protein
MAEDCSPVPETGSSGIIRRAGGPSRRVRAFRRRAERTVWGSQERGGADMRACGRRRWVRVVVLALALTLVASNLETLVWSSDPAIALAGENNDKKDNKNKGEDGDEDHVARGMVLEIDTLKDPPELVLAGADGAMLVRVLKTDEIVINGVKLCDHLKLDGEKIHELLFEATQIEVETRTRC